MADLIERIQQFNQLQLPGQPMMMHVGTANLVGSTSAGGSGVGFGLSFGTSWVDEECQKMEACLVPVEVRRRVAVVREGRSRSEDRQRRAARRARLCRVRGAHERPGSHPHSRLGVGERAMGGEAVKDAFGEALARDFARVTAISFAVGFGLGFALGFALWA